MMDNMATKPGEDEIAEAQDKAAPAVRKRKKRRTTGASAAASCDAGMCDDVIRSIFARVPARTAAASTALSTHHRRMILCPEFRSLHCRLGPPLPQPHIAYIATANIRREENKDPVSKFHGFHVAGIGLDSNSPMRSLTGSAYLTMTYVNTCNGIVLLTDSSRTDTCVLWNPAVADDEKEVTVPVSLRNHNCAILGLGYGRRSQTYKLLLLRWRKPGQPTIASTYPKKLLVYALGGAAAEPVSSAGLHDKKSLRTLLSAGDGDIIRKSLYIDGIIYLFHRLDFKKAVILAFDVDEETVTSINTPGEHWTTSQLLEISGRPCVETHEGKSRALWMLTEDHQWEQRCVIKELIPYYGQETRDLKYCSIAGVWDCSGVLVLYLDESIAGNRWLHMTDASTMKTFQVKMTPDRSSYAFCWGYRPTLLSPGSIVDGKLSQDEERRCRDGEKAQENAIMEAYIMEAQKPVNEDDRREGHRKTLNTVCFMEFLVRIMQNLPDNMEGVVQMSIFKSARTPSDSVPDRNVSRYRHQGPNIILY